MLVYCTTPHALWGVRCLVRMHTPFFITRSTARVQELGNVSREYSVSSGKKNVFENGGTVVGQCLAWHEYNMTFIYNCGLFPDRTCSGRHLPGHPDFYPLGACLYH
jgi:hypothetical protein